MLHPIVAQLHPSEEQEKAISAVGTDVVVTAGAGTGKTTALVARYLSLLAAADEERTAEQAHPLRSLVAITFTRKAAREMRNRVRQAMRQFRSRPGLTVEERSLWDEHYRELDAARIQTIHGLCGEILRAHPAEARVDPRFGMLEEAQAELLRVRALEEALAWAADDAVSVQLFALLKERKLRDTLDGMLASRLDTEEALGALPEDVAMHWRRSLAEHQQRVLEQLCALPAWVESVEVLQENRGSPGDGLEEQRREALSAVCAGGSLEDQIAALSALENIRLNRGSAKAWPHGSDQTKMVKQALRTLRELWKQHKPSQWTFSELDAALAAAYPALRRLFEFALQRYSDSKEQEEALDFDDLEGRALRLLQSDKAVRKRWQERVHALLVDEFQDTNGRQRELMECLNGGQGKLFAVGDAKQSIYRFRGADVTVFRRERERVLRQGGKVFSLDTSYRAHKGLVQALNDLLRPVLGEAEDPARPWAEPFAALQAHRQEPGRGFTAPHIEWHLTVGTKTAGALDRAADALAGRLMELVESGDCGIWEGGQLGQLAYGDVAILCRASSSFPCYEDALERAGIPFLTVAGGGFYDRPEVRDLLNSLQALADPQDDLALAGLLRSAAFGVSDVELYRLCEERKAVGAQVPLWHVLSGRQGDFRSEAGQRAAQIVAELQQLVGRTPVADVLKALLDATDYRAAWIGAGQGRAARNIAKLLADAHTSAIVGVGEFLEYVQGLRDVGAREAEARALAEGVVQIMTVHQAKGLEFPVVVLGDITYGGGRSAQGVLIHPQLGVLPALQDEDRQCPSVYRLAQQRDVDQGAAETDRLLYVAATRAREKLIVSGCVSQTGLSDRASGWLGRLATAHRWVVPLPEEYDEEGARVLQMHLEAGETTMSCALYEPQWQATVSSVLEQPQTPAEPFAPPTMLDPVLAGQARVDEPTAEAERDPPQRVWRVVPLSKRERAPAWVVGKLVHESLALWRFPDDGFGRWAEARACSYGLIDPGRLHNAIRASRQVLERFVANDLKRLMDSAQQRLHEVPYHVMRDGRLESGSIDALYLRDGQWTVVEFKTDEIRSDARLVQLLSGDDYRGQAERYIEAMERLVGVRPRFVWCMLNYAGSVRLQAHPEA